jgi:aminopeptidase C
LKESIISIFHHKLGYELYLELFGIFKVKTLFWDKRKADYFFFNKMLTEDANIIVIGACSGITTIPVATGIEREIFEVAKQLIAKHIPIIYCELWNNEKKSKSLNLLQTYH